MKGESNMKNPKADSNTKRDPKKKLKKSDITLTGMALPPALFIFVFSYLPIFGLIIAFKDFKVTKGIFGSEWVGFKNFEFFFKSNDAWIILRNTLGMNLLFIFLTLVVSVGIALLLNEIRSRVLTKVMQTIMFVPYILSWVVVSFMLYAFLTHNYGIFNTLFQKWGFDPVAWYGESKYWPFILSFMFVWKNAGYNSIIYYASIMGIDESYYEAAALDGANRRQATWYITIPLLKRIIICMLILQLGKVMYSDFGLFYQLPRDMGALFSTTQVLDTYTYRALRVTGNISVGAAVSCFQAIVGFFFILTANRIVKKIEPDMAMF